MNGSNINHPMNINHPVGGIDYPRTLQEFDEWFPNEEECFKYIQRIRWSAGFICPTCKGNKDANKGSTFEL
jgi:hypothetical protein